MPQFRSNRCCRALFTQASIIVFSLFIAEVNAQVVIPPGTPQLGSSNTVSADAPVPRPLTKPCTVELFQNLEFADFNTKTFSYTPPSRCRGPWSRVVFTADFTVTEGRQYDRTTQFFIDNVNVFYGTTAEPRSTLSPSWHVERDVTDLSAIFKAAQTGEAMLGNLVNSTYTGIIYANAALEFYPAGFLAPAPPVPDVVVPLPNGGGAANLGSPSSELTQDITLPTNTERLYLDVISQSQSADEQWFFCVPNDVAAELETCGNTGFRETEISIDGQPAGVAPVYPWIYTGGIDPYLWAPIPGLQTLNFKPYRVDLTPFAAVFADGKPHALSLSVYNADGYFLVDATLLAFLDHGSSVVRGGVLSNTLSAAPNPVVTEDLQTSADGITSGTVSVTSARDFSISGYVQTSHGRIHTTVEQRVNFSNVQQFVVNATQDTQNLTQSNTVQAKTITRDGILVTEDEKQFSYPFTFDLTATFNPDGSITEPNVSNQKYLETETQSVFGIPVFKRTISNEVASADTDTIAVVNGNYSLTGHTGQKSSESYFSKDSLGLCYSEKLTAANSALTGYSYGQGCHANKNWW